MSEPIPGATNGTTDSDTTIEELTEDEERWLDEERRAFVASASGEFDEAISTWTELLGDPAAVEFFRQDGTELFNEIVTELVTAHLYNGDQERARAVADKWNVPFDDAAPR